MTANWLNSFVSLAAVSFASVVTVGAHVLASRRWPAIGMYRTLAVGVALGGYVLVLSSNLLSLWFPRHIGIDLANALIFLCFVYVYFHFNNLGETGRRIRLLIELDRAGEPLAHEALVSRYGAREVLERRLGRMTFAGQLELNGSRYQASGSAVAGMATLTNLLHLVVFGRRRSNRLATAIAIASASNPSPPSIADRDNAVRCIKLAIGLALLANLPMFVVHAAYGDDWAWIWVHYWHGAAMIQDFMWQLAHPGYGPILNAVFALGGDEPGRLARIVAVAFHLGSGWLLWKVLAIDARSEIVPATVAIVYLMAPFLGGLRGTMSHVVYDVAIFGYLASIVLSGRNDRTSIVMACPLVLVGLLLETLVAFEILRWWYLWKRSASMRDLVRRAAPCASVVGAFVLLRATVIVPYGNYYAGHNTLRFGGLADFASHGLEHLRFFVSSIEPMRFAAGLVAFDQPVIWITLALLAGSIGLLRYRVVERPPSGYLAEVAVVGVALLVVGALPYVLTQRAPHWTGFYSRLAVMSQFGAIMLAAAAVHIIHSRALQAVVLGAVVFVTACVQVQFGKWMLYDELVVEDFRSQLARRFATTDKELLIVGFSPSSDRVLYLHRCLANYDINVALGMKRADRGSFAYDRDCGAEVYTQAGKCGATGFDGKPCPSVRTRADFVLRPEVRLFTRLKLFELMRVAAGSHSFEAGRLEIRAGGPAERTN